MVAEEAMAIVMNQYPNAVIHYVSNYIPPLLVPQITVRINGTSNYLCGWCHTEEDAWIAAARRVSVLDKSTFVRSVKHQPSFWKKFKFW